MSTVEVRVPDMGNFDSVSVIDVLVKPGDSIDVDTPLVTLEIGNYPADALPPELAAIPAVKPGSRGLT